MSHFIGDTAHHNIFMAQKVHESLTMYNVRPTEFSRKSQYKKEATKEHEEQITTAV